LSPTSISDVIPADIPNVAKRLPKPPNPSLRNDKPLPSNSNKLVPAFLAAAPTP
jgi:hypothetical protein